jgi:hypothetical protein
MATQGLVLCTDVGQRPADRDAPREKGQLQELSAQLRAEVADKMALLDEFEQKFARQYR